MYAVPGMVDDITIRRRFKLIERHLDERMRRLVAAAEAEAVGFGGRMVKQFGRLRGRRMCAKNALSQRMGAAVSRRLQKLAFQRLPITECVMF